MALLGAVRVTIPLDLHEYLRHCKTANQWGLLHLAMEGQLLTLHSGPSLDCLSSSHCNVKVLIFESMTVTTGNLVAIS